MSQKGQSSQGGKGNKKAGRDAAKGDKYRRSCRREKNKVRSLTRHLVRNPNDQVAKECLGGLPAF